MNVMFRTDASLQIGTGHVMRCLALANELKRMGALCHFATREHEGHLGNLIKAKDYSIELMAPNAGFQTHQPNNYEKWLGTAWQDDATDTQVLLKKNHADWLIVDHYGLDAKWEDAVRRDDLKIMVIDDLANRPHACDVLLDQNLGRSKVDYERLVPEACELLIGPRHALLRPEFAALRDYSLKRRKEPQFKSILISMGGVDLPNVTAMVLKALLGCELPEDVEVTVILGVNAPSAEDVRKIAQSLPWIVNILVNVNDVAQRLADCDIAIGAAGSSSWERCCLGVPSILVVTADNQRAIAECLDDAQAALTINDPGSISSALPKHIRHVRQEMNSLSLSTRCANLTEGLGALSVARFLWQIR
jgi:UDP-2,4-diacetamido-2,4,6-trideoxy-beta-L-altropyranose hydrolase